VKAAPEASKSETITMGERNSLLQKKSNDTMITNPIQ